MHGRLKIKTTEEQREAKRKEQEEKLKIYKSLTNKLFEKRANNELDEEALNLSAQILQRNPEFYTLWNYRKEILIFMKENKTKEELQKLGSEEQELTEISFMKNPKSYAAWHHRFWSLEYQPDPDWRRELKLCNKFIALDERNFHCWNYRRRVKSKCNVDEKDELQFTSDLIAKNFSNYSSWHYRSKLLPVVHPGTKPGSVDEDILLAEYDLVQNAAFTDPNDQSAWFYHRWLLGRGSEKFEIQAISVIPKMQTIAVLLSHPLQICNEKVKLFIDDTEITAPWVSSDHKNSGSRFWYCKIPSDIFCPFNEASIVKVDITYGTEKSALSCKFNDFHSFSKDFAKTFCMDLSDVTKDVLAKELESCEQLNELEPDNKWVLFTSILLMRAIDCQQYDATVCKYLEQLMEIDRLRKHYYEDLRSKFITENYLMMFDPNLREVKLTNRNLTSLHHFECFHHVISIDLSNNKLHSLYPLRYLIGLEELCLDSNEIDNCEDIRDMLCLKKLSLKNNLIQSVASMKPLGTCKAMQSLLIAGNLVTEQENYHVDVLNLLGPITLDDTQLVK